MKSSQLLVPAYGSIARLIGAHINQGCFCGPSSGEESMADIDELKATFEQVVAAICRRDASAYSGFWHEQIVAFPPLSPFAARRGYHSP
jgi:hypothetical protein